jgi:hypothetical protein
MGKIGKGAFGSAHLLVHKDSQKYFVIKKIRLAKQTGADIRGSTLKQQLVSSTLTRLTPCFALRRLAAQLSSAGARHGECGHLPNANHPDAAPSDQEQHVG